VTFDLALAPSGSVPFDVVGYGESSLDFLAVVPTWPAPDTKVPLRRFIILPGGQTATAVVASARLGCRARYVGVFGDDRWGADIRAAIACSGVDLVAVERRGVSSRTAVVLVDDAGRRTILERRDPRLSLEAGDVDARVFQSGRILLTDATDVRGALRAARAARQTGTRVMLDVDRPMEDVEGVEALLAEADVVIAGGEFAPAYTGRSPMGAALAALEAAHPGKLVISTLGADGSLARFRGREIRTPARPVQVVDTTGAGDAFRGGFAARWIAAGGPVPVDALLEYANAVAGLSCRALGAQAALPTSEDVSRLVAGGGPQG